MEITCISSGSKGNAYTVSDGVTTVLLDAGVSGRELNKALKFDLSKISGALITHEHGDHCLGVCWLMSKAIDVYMTKGTCSGTQDFLQKKAKKAIIDLPNSPYYKQVLPGNWISIGSFNVYPFSLKDCHDALEPTGFILKSTETNETLLYATDTMYVPLFTGVSFDYVMIECNHDVSIIKDKIANGSLNASLGNRIILNHLSLNSCKDALEQMDLKNTKCIYLIHLSESNSNANKFKREIKKLTGCMVEVF